MEIILLVALLLILGLNMLVLFGWWESNKHLIRVLKLNNDVLGMIFDMLSKIKDVAEK